MTDKETGVMKIKDLFETNPLLTGRTEIDTVNKINAGLVWSCTGMNFFTHDPDDVEWNWGDPEFANLIVLGTSVFCQANVNLPNGATITKAIVYGSESNESWTLYRAALNTGTVGTMATAAFDTEDTTVSNATIDNNTYGYFFRSTSLDANDEIRGARITYTI